MALPVPIIKTVQRSSARRFFLVLLVLGGTLIIGAAAVWRHEPGALLGTTLGYFGYELGLNALLVTAAWFGLRATRRRVTKNPVVGTRPGATVMIAAHNERSCIFETLESVFSQQGVDVRVIVASDGSTDGMNEALIARRGLVSREDSSRWTSPDERLCLLALPKLGKGGVLNAALAQVTDEVVITLDADTRLAPGALASLTATFDDPEVVAAGGFVYVRNAAGLRSSWLVRYQYWEYVKNFMWRIGLAHLGMCLQVSGAFGAFRTAVLREVGGFSGRSLVEDYEVIFRLHERLRNARRAYRVEVAPGAVAYTEPPDTVPSFVHQRTRWFTGFLQTMWDYRRMVGNPRMGVVGFLMLPIKCVDAILPLWGFLSLAILLASLSGGATHWQRLGLELYLGRWSVDLLLSGVMWRWHRRLFPERSHGISGPWLALHMATEGLVFNWFRQAAVLNAYSWFVRRVQRWHQPRWVATPPVAGD